MKRSNLILAIIGTTALVMGPLAPVVPYIGADAALADRGGGGGGKDGGGSDRGGSDKAGKSADRGGGKAAGNAAGARSDKAGTAAKAKASGKAAAEKRVAKAPVKATPAKPVTVAKAEKSPEGPGRGALASELKGLNAAHASPQALANASPNSQVGRIATYRDAVLGTRSATGDIADAQTVLAAARDALSAYDGSYDGRTRAEIEADIARLDPESPDYDAEFAGSFEDPEAALSGLQDDLAAAVAHEDGREELAGAVTAAEDDLAAAEQAAEDAAAAEADALLAASGGRTLSPEALAELHRLLGLDGTATPEPEPVTVAASE
ncbi:MAG TPA: hypothetical protein PKD10_04075 [Paracoccaceae bacterium]|nr:hypothetical protein [Paracoccaceae bacterium]HMO72591.1 hypothetical protein [Paracoccaceae bacterium]